jgi:hypothetical protein
MARALSDHVILPVGAALAMLGAHGLGVAKADTPSLAPWTAPMGDESAATYWTDVTRMTDLGGNENDARALAGTICTALRSGTPEGNLIVDMAKEDQRQVGNVTMEVHGAEWHFCPDRY